MTERQKLAFSSDYMEGAYPGIIRRLSETNLEHTPGYGSDSYCTAARERIRSACCCPQAEVEFLIGGTQTNATMIDALLAPYQCVVAAVTGHINGHEAGAIEFGGHKVYTLPQQLGKLSAADLEEMLATYYADDNHEHMVMPGMLYLSQPTEYGTLYSLAELTELRRICDRYRMSLYVDGARLAYALGSAENDVTLPDLARLCDAFYIGGTKCGALFGEAVVIPDPQRIPHLFTMIKQHGALLAKGRLLGLQFDELFRDDLYLHIGQQPVAYAREIEQALVSHGFRLFFPTPSNQVFVIVENGLKQRLDQRLDSGFWEKYDDAHTVIRLATSWATTRADVDALLALIAETGC